MIQRPHPCFLQRYFHHRAIAFCQEILPLQLQQRLQDFIEAMEVLSKEQIHPMRERLVKLRSVTAAAKTETEPSVEQAFQQRKCRRLLRYPTLEC